jgi:hypothetical protein
MRLELKDKTRTTYLLICDIRQWPRTLLLSSCMERSRRPGLGFNLKAAAARKRKRRVVHDFAFF